MNFGVCDAFNVFVSKFNEPDLIYYLMKLQVFFPLIIQKEKRGKIRSSYS